MKAWGLAIVLLLAVAAVRGAGLGEGSKASEESDKEAVEVMVSQQPRSKQAFVFPAAWLAKSVYGSGDKRNPGIYSFGLGKRSKSVGPYSFGLGKRDDDDYWRRYARSSRFGFGLGKRSEAESPEEYEDGAVLDDYEPLRGSGEVEPEKRTAIREPSFYPRGRPMKLQETFPMLGKRLPVYNFGLGK